MNGDLLVSLQFSELLAYHREKEATGTLVVREYEHQIPYGVVRSDDGLMTGIEIVSDRAAKTLMDMGAMKRIHQAAYDNGAMVRLGMNNILMSPPLTISEDEVNTVLSALDAGFSAA